MAKIQFHQKAIILNEQGKFLILKASYKHLRWDLPGGAVEIPETHDVALLREMKEEAGIEVSNIRPLFVESGYSKERDEYVLFIGYVCHAHSEEIHLSSEHTEYRWVTKDEFIEMDATPYLKDFIQKWQGEIV